MSTVYIYYEYINTHSIYFENVQNIICIFLFYFLDSWTKSFAYEKIVRVDGGEYSQIRAKILLMQSKKTLSNCFATLALAS